MLLFSTRLPLKESVIKEDIIELIREWITGSPHDEVENLEYTISDGDKVFLVVQENVLNQEENDRFLYHFSQKIYIFYTRYRLRKKNAH